MPITIRFAETYADCLALEQLQIAIWQCDPIEVIPANMLIVMTKQRGCVLIAEDEGRAVGFAMAMTLRNSKSTPSDAALSEPYFYSHVVGILPEYQGRGIGERLKWLQRDIASADKLQRIVWTYDPLEARNAHFNLNKLGVLARRYIDNAYGAMRDSLNAGIPTDRFEVDWYITSGRVAAHVNAIRTRLPVIAPLLNPVARMEALPHPSEAIAAPSEAVVHIAIPRDYQAIKRADNGLALAWRLTTRAAFHSAFAAGYTAIGILNGEIVSRYVLIDAVG